MILTVVHSSRTVTLFHAVPYVGAPKCKQFPITGRGEDPRSDARKRAALVWSEISKGRGVPLFGGDEV